jgi:hypothetical protein
MWTRAAVVDIPGKKMVPSSSVADLINHCIHNVPVLKAAFGDRHLRAQAVAVQHEAHLLRIQAESAAVLLNHPLPVHTSIVRATCSALCTAFTLS